MRYLALACDYDGTLATDGRVDEQTLDALKRLRESGRRLIMVTGRQIDDLLAVFPATHLFDWIVAENGALLYRPASREEKRLGESPPEAFVAALEQRGVEPLAVGRVIVATWEPHETTVLETIRELGLELQVIFNKGAVMVLPAGINKATGLSAALDELALSPHNVVGIGDAENDHAFLKLCECGVAVANALPMVKEQADLVTADARGAGTVELIERLLASDLSEITGPQERHPLVLGTREDGGDLWLAPYGSNLLLTGSSGAGKSTLATALLERLTEQGYQFCLIDPEGDYESYQDAVVLGDSQHEPDVAAALALLERPNQPVIVNLLGVALEQRPAFLADFLPRLQALRARTARPHWIIIDEAHHMLPRLWSGTTATLPERMKGLLLITVHPDHVAPTTLATVDALIAVGREPERALQTFAAAVGESPPALEPVELAPGEALFWSRRGDGIPTRFSATPPRAEHQRHRRKYAEGALGADKSFYFRGPQGKLNLRAQNLALFTQLAGGIDDTTWLYHLHQGDYSRWFREAIKDDELAAAAAQVEQQPELPPAESRARIKDSIEQRYTLPE
ncbi:MAG: HAD family hydrolase [Candidatus Competibacteraceae bacterium]